MLNNNYQYLCDKIMKMKSIFICNHLREIIFMKKLVLLIVIFLIGIIDLSAQSKKTKAIFDLPKKNYKLISQKTVYTKKTTISRDFDNDGIKESITVGLGQINFNIIGYQNNRGYLLGPELPSNPTDPCRCVDEDGDLLKDFYIQISSIDLDNDNKEELIISVGNMAFTSQTVIYKVRRSDTLPFIKVCQIEGHVYPLYLNENNEIIVPIGVRGLYEGYKMQDGRMKITNKL